MLTVLSVIGTRPEAIKMAPVIKQLGKLSRRVRSVVCVTGQHRQMLDQVLNLFGISPDYDLDLMRPDQTLCELTGRLFIRLEPVVQQVQPDWILAQGDTTTVMVAALVGFYHKVWFGHVEAGLRTGDKMRPYPEEVNRRVTDIVADAFFAPTERARQTLIDEGVSESVVFLTGNTVVDALLDVTEWEYDWNAGPLAQIPTAERIVLFTAHRRESFGHDLSQLCLALRELAARLEGHGVHFVFPVHLNPKVRKQVYETLRSSKNVSLIGPLDYLSQINLIKRSTLILTDSGGIQEEAPSFGVPVLVMREQTERPEAIEAGVACLVGTDCDRIVSTAERLLQDPVALSAMRAPQNPYGDGKAAQRIVSVLVQGVNT